MAKAAVQRAVEELRATFAGHRIDSVDDSQGGAVVTVHDADYGPKYAPTSGWISFAISFQYGATDCYPHFVVPELRRLDGKPLGQGFSKVPWQGQPATQVSRRSRHW